MKLKLLIIYIVVSFLCSQESYNAELVGNWFEPNENYWSEYVSDFNDIWGYESEDGTKYALMGGWDGTYIIDISTTPSTPQLVSFIPGSESSHVGQTLCQISKIM